MVASTKAKVCARPLTPGGFTTMVVVFVRSCELFVWSHKYVFEVLQSDL